MRSFGRRLALVVLAAFVLRLVYALAFAPGTAGAVDDAFWYQEVSSSVAHGHGFMVPFHATVVPTAEHGPLYPLALAGAIKLGITSDDLLRSLGAIFGAVTVTAVGLIGRRIGGDALGLLAAAIAAVSPLLIAADGALLSETLYGAMIALALLAALRLADRPSVRNAALAGVLIALAALTRSEALVLLVLIAVPLAWRGERRRRWLRVAAPLVCAALVISPWVIRNWSVFDRPVLTNNEGDLLGASNCNATYSGIDLGYEVILCLDKATGNEAEKAAQWRREGLGYARDHAGRLPIVVPVRFMRTWGLYQPFRSAHERTRNSRLTKAGVIFSYFLIALAIAGAATLWRRRQRTALLVLIAPIVMVSLAAMASYGSVRFRHAAEIPLCVLAAAGAIWLAERIRARRQDAATAASASARVA